MLLPCIFLLLQDDEFFSWVNPAYLDIGVQSSIGEKFEAESEIELTDFLQVTPITRTTVVYPFSWVNPAYLDIGVQSSIGEKFEAESEVELTHFLQVTSITSTTVVYPFSWVNPAY